MSKICALCLFSILFVSCVSTRILGNGHEFNIKYKKGKPILAENENVKITFSGFDVENDDPKKPILTWSFTFDDKKGNIENVEIYDVSDSEKLLLEEKIEKKDDGKYALKKIGLELNEKNYPWLFDTEDTNFFFKFTFTNSDGRKSTVYQHSKFDLALKSKFIIWMLGKNGEYERIITKYSENVDDYSAGTLYYVAVAFFKKGDYIKCLNFLDLSVEKDKTVPLVHFIRGMALTYVGKPEEAVESFRVAIELDPENPDFYDALGELYYHLKRLDESLEAYMTAVEKGVTPEKSYMMIPRVYGAKGDYKNALKWAYITKDKIATQEEKTNSYLNVLYDIAYYETAIKSYEKAETVLNELIGIAPDFYPAYPQLVQVYNGKKEYDKAETYKKKLYDAHKNGLLSEELRDGFFFDQFYVNGKLIRGFETFTDDKGKFYYKHIFYVHNESNELEFTIQTENSPVAIAYGSSRYLVGMDRGDTHFNSGIGFNDSFQYEDLKNVVIDIINNKTKAVISTQKKK